MIHSRFIKTFFTFLLGSLIFVLIYTQSPLFSSNQNQYFLHGMAQAGLGSLNQDWLANTKEPTPVFTFLVKWVFLILRDPAWFYIIYTLLAGVYFCCLLGIMDNLFRIRESRTKFLIASTLILIAHSAALRFTLGNTLGENWRFLFDGGVAGQRLLGTVLQPSLFGVLLVAALFFYVSGKPIWAAVLASTTALIHPTYLFAAGLLIAGFMLHTWLEEKNIRKILIIGLASLAIVTPILMYIFNNFWGAEDAEKAQHILTVIRLPHHALASAWFDKTVLIKFFLVVAALFLLRKVKKIFIPLLFIFGGVLFLSGVQMLTKSAFLALIFPWRPSVLLVPIASSTLLARLAAWLTGKFKISGGINAKMVEIVCLVIILALCVIGGSYMRSTFTDVHKTPEAALLSWVKETSTDKDRYLIPINLETLRTATLRPAFVDYFAIPYSNPDVIQWYHRVLAVNKFFDTGSCEEFYYLRNDGKLTYVITEKNKVQPACETLDLVYEDDYYVAYHYVKKK